MPDETQSSGTTSANKGVKKGLPAVGLVAAEDAASKLWDVARLGAASPEAFARQFGASAKASGGTWNTRMSLLRGFKLIETDGNQISLSQLGQQIVNGSNVQDQIAARRTAMMNLKAYRDLVESFEGTQLPETATLATRLQFEYGKTEEFARRAAQAFVDSLVHAEMKDSDDVVRRTGQLGTLPARMSSQPSDEEDEAEAVEIDAAFDEALIGDESQIVEVVPDTKPQPVSAVSVSIAVSLDLSAFTAEDVILILKELRSGVDPV